ncbi:MAG: hydrogenase assembly protein HupF [Planctomycetota bacterium]
MCLALPGKILTVEGDDAVVDLHGNRANVSVALTPGVAVGAWVLVHAGFAIAAIDEDEALKTWGYLQEAADAFADELHDGALIASNFRLPRTRGEEAPT